MRYRLIDVGRDRWTGEVEAQSGAGEHVEVAVMSEAKKHLGSRDVEMIVEYDKNQLVKRGVILVGGCRTVGKFKRIKATR